MATKYLINNVRSGTRIYWAGAAYDTSADDAEIVRIEASGGVLLDSTAALAAAAVRATALRVKGAPAEEILSVMLGAAVSSTGAGAVPTTRTLTAGAGLTGGGTLAADRSFAVSFGAVGEMAAAGVAAANAAGSATKSAPIDHVHAHGAQALGAGDGHALATTTVAGFLDPADKVKMNSIQAGTGTLESGVAPIVGVTLTASSRIFVSMKDPGAGAITGFASLEVQEATRNVGAGSFVVQAIDDSKSVIGTAVCTFDWLVIF